MLKLHARVRGYKVINNFANYPCSGCGACAVICPNNCITMQLNKDGFLNPVIDYESCTECNLCDSVCYRNLPDVSDVNLYSTSSVFAAIAKDKEILYTSSSGGVAPILSRYGVNAGYNICGVVYDPKTNRCYHTIAKNNDELESFKGSKYLQSETLPAFSEFKDGEKYMVFGTPCQIYGLRQIIKQRGWEENFILIDLFCKGVPSKLLWDSYIKYIISENKMEKPFSVNFRDKRVSWHKFSITITDILGNEYSNTIYDDIFFQCFIKNVCFNDSCYPCIFRHHMSGADIRLGDFWGTKYYNHDEGTSMVVIFNDVGRNIWDKIKDEFWIEENEPSIVIESQRFDIINSYQHRQNILADLFNGDTLDEIYSRYDMGNIQYKVKEKLK